MKISYNWLKEYIKTDLSVAKVDELLTDTGLEVEGVELREAYPGGLKGLVVGQVKEVSSHPGADRLNCTKVDIGADELLDIVCGAPNVAVGQKVAVATVGAKLYPSEGEPFKIKKSKIRGEVSMGMLCAEDEIGLGAGHDGIMVLPEETVVGVELSTIFSGKDDYVIEIGLTPNRTDAISHIGVARDLAAVLNKETPTTMTQPAVSKEASGEPKVTIDIEAADGCVRYCGIELDGIQVGPSPEWMQNRLRAIGLNPINNVVDITNYVMHETGQPLHAFDADKIDGNMVRVRRASEGEKFTTLDDVERELSADDLLIANEQSGMCLAGVFGGKESGVSESTKKLFLESACFDMVSVRKSAKRHGLSTDSSFRFERGVDPNQTDYALWRAVDLLKEHASAVVSSELQDIYPQKVEPLQVAIQLKRVFSLIGEEIDKAELKSILTSLDISVAEQADDQWLCSIPTYRVDVTREADVVEEILRIYGYNNIPLPEKMNMVVTHRQGVDKHAICNSLADTLTGLGFSEIMNNSLSAADHAELLGSNAAERVEILNPLSNELNVMRQTMLWSGLEVIAFNQNRKRADLRLFEYGAVYSRSEDKFMENEQLALFITGSKKPENWEAKQEDTSVYDLRAALTQLLSKAGSLDQFSESDHVSPEFEQAVQFNKGERVLAIMGRVSKAIQKKFDIDKEVYFASVNVAALMKTIGKQKIVVKGIPKFPMVRRDLSLLIDKSVTFGQIELTARKAGAKLLREVNLFDVYEGKNLPDGKRSYAVSFQLLNEEKTLVDKEVDKVMMKIQSRLESELGASLR